MISYQLSVPYVLKFKFFKAVTWLSFCCFDCILFFHCRELDPDRIDVIEVLASTDIAEPPCSPKLRHRVNNWLPSNKNQEAKANRENPKPQSSIPNFRINNQSHNPEVTKNWFKHAFMFIGVALWIIPARMYFYKDIQPFIESYYNMRVHVLLTHVLLLIPYYLTNQSLRSFVWEMYSEPFHN